MSIHPERQYLHTKGNNELVLFSSFLKRILYTQKTELSNIFIKFLYTYLKHTTDCEDTRPLFTVLHTSLQEYNQRTYSVNTFNTFNHVNNYNEVIEQYMKLFTEYEHLDVANQHVHAFISFLLKIRDIKEPIELINFIHERINFDKNPFLFRKLSNYLCIKLGVNYRTALLNIIYQYDFCKTNMDKNINININTNIRDEEYTPVMWYSLFSSSRENIYKEQIRELINSNIQYRKEAEEFFTCIKNLVEF